jgi:ElaB/YqjD/DUF883 family membrane-anchored ribosome-binding protein
MANATNANFTNEANKAMNAARDVAGDVADRAKQVASSVADAAGKKAGEVTSAVGSTMRNVGERIRENLPSEGYVGQASRSVASTLDEGGHYLEEHGLGGLAEDMGGMIKRNPVPAVLVAIGVGFMIGRLLSK